MAALSLSANINKNGIPNVAPNDIYLDSDGNIALAIDQEAVLQNCSQAAKTILGEMVLNTDQGIPYFETVFEGVPNIDQFSASLRQAFLSVNGVLEVLSLITSRVDNNLLYSAIIRTIYGTGAVNGGL